MTYNLQVTSIGKNKVKVIRNHKTMVMNYSIDRFLFSLHRWEEGDLIQNAFPYLTFDEREFLITGILPEEFDKLAEWAEVNMEKED